MVVCTSCKHSKRLPSFLSCKNCHNTLQAHIRIHAVYTAHIHIKNCIHSVHTHTCTPVKSHTHIRFAWHIIMVHCIVRITLNVIQCGRHIGHCEKHHIPLYCIGFYYYRLASFLKNLGCKIFYLVGWWNS